MKTFHSRKKSCPPHFKRKFVTQVVYRIAEVNHSCHTALSWVHNNVCVVVVAHDHLTKPWKEHENAKSRMFSKMQERGNASLERLHFST